MDPEPGRSDGLLHVNDGRAYRLTRRPRVSVLTMVGATDTTVLKRRLLDRSGDNAVLARVLLWLL